MKAHVFFRPALPAAFCVLVALGFAAPALRAAAETVEPAAENRAKASRPRLDKGMTAEEVIGLIGKPEMVTSLTPAEAKAEKWIYRRKLNERTVQEAATTQDVPAYLGFSSDGPVMGTAVEIQYNFKHVTTYQMTSLLMIDGRLSVAKQWKETSQSYGK